MKIDGLKIKGERNIEMVRGLIEVHAFMNISLANFEVTSYMSQSDLNSYLIDVDASYCF